VYLDIRVPRAQYDVNLSPDKRDFLFRGKDILKVTHYQSTQFIADPFTFIMIPHVPQ
jgi:hypothetical protein